MSPHLQVAGRTDVGLQRENNEDAYLVRDGIAVVADGVGGSVAGELASSIVVDTFAAADIGRYDGDLERALAEIIGQANAAVAAAVDADGELAGMGTTVTAALWLADRMTIGQVGDSRAYCLPREADHDLIQVTRDDSYVQYLVDQGRITAAEAAVHPRRNVIVQAIDGTDVVPTCTTVALRAGDRYLLCSDGLSDYVERAEITQVLRRVADPGPAVDALIDAALAAGAPDNVTVIVADVRAE